MAARDAKISDAQLVVLEGRETGDETSTPTRAHC